jgi:parvulin-like peptidyl-prolyl isomerase
MLPFPFRSATYALLALSMAAGAQTPAPAAAPVLPVSPAAAAPATAPATASLTAPDTVLIRNALATLTRADYDLEITRLPPESRGGFGTDPTRVNALLNRMLVSKTMAAQARKAGMDKLPETQQRIAWETERMLAAMYVESIEAEAAKEFDARPGIEGAARERWIADPDKYRTPEQASVTHIMFDLSKHGKDDALKLARDARARIIAGADMNELAKQISEDPMAARNGGRMENLTRDKMDPAIARAVFALAKPGDVSEPFPSPVGYHVIRLDSKRASRLRPFPEVKELIIAEMRRQYVDRRRSDRMTEIRNDPQVVVNAPAVEALVTRVDQEAVRKAMEQATAAMPALKAAPAANPAAK